MCEPWGCSQASFTQEHNTMSQWQIWVGGGPGGPGFPLFWLKKGNHTRNKRWQGKQNKTSPPPSPHPISSRSGFHHCVPSQGSNPLNLEWSTPILRLPCLHFPPYFHTAGSPVISSVFPALHPQEISKTYVAFLRFFAFSKSLIFCLFKYPPSTQE